MARFALQPTFSQAMNDPRIREQIRRIIDLADSIADEYQHLLNHHASTGIPAAGVGPVARLVRVIETCERTARDFHAILDHPAGLGIAAPDGVVSYARRVEPDPGDPPRVAADDG